MNSNLILYLIGGLMAVIAWPALMPDKPGLSSTLPPAAILANAAGKPVLLQFTASWCGPCQRVKPEVQSLKAQLAGRAEIVVVDVDQNQALAQQYNVHGIPCFIALKNGKETERMSGAIPQSEMKRLLGLN